ncbi:PLP-dependent cysteine synthase family protein [Salsipaludibacter albus]|uniref:PLP-dependent cysteine synthase family protein n=1 Tax=Salsipaludibacter albus TaxID=2849650 RepID=UPI001EE419FF|nr:cysteine synthase family protein [Salsipaludibacter albus]MBY5163893.1 cysteine synthase family protein [Salsipaludibacter albus]
MRFHDITQSIGGTPLVGLPRLSPEGYEIHLKLEGANPTGSVKDRVALAMVTDAEERGLLGPGSRILEPTSGNTGIALAAICRSRGYHLTCVMPSNTSQERRQLLTLFGADIVDSPAQEGSNGSVRLAQQMAEDDPDVHMPFQYGNPANPRAHYETTAPEIIDDLPDVAAFVAGLGTGGTVTGAGRRLKAHNPDIKVYAAEPQYGDLVYGLRNLDEGYVPEVLDPDVLDSRIKVDSRKALAATRRLATVEGIFAGVSTGASLAVAIRVCSRLPVGSKVVALSPDGGWKYLSTGAYDAGDVDELSSDLENTLWA